MAHRYNDDCRCASCNREWFAELEKALKRATLRKSKKRKK